MTTDKELLEMAAKAVYFAFEGQANQIIESGWNPIVDDGDALRLAVKLKFDVDIRTLVCVVEHLGAQDTFKPTYEFYKDDEIERLAATRRAIVRAAAEIGKSMKRNVE